MTPRITIAITLLTLMPFGATLGCGGSVTESASTDETYDTNRVYTTPPSNPSATTPPKTSTTPKCDVTRASQTACWGPNERYWVGRTSVDYSACGDDGRAFVDGSGQMRDAEHPNGYDCYRGSNVDRVATVWCCL